MAANRDKWLLFWFHLDARRTGLLRPVSSPGSVALAFAGLCLTPVAGPGLADRAGAPWLGRSDGEPAGFAAIGVAFFGRYRPIEQITDRQEKDEENDCFHRSILTCARFI